MEIMWKKKQTTKKKTLIITNIKILKWKVFMLRQTYVYFFDWKLLENYLITNLKCIIFFQYI